MGVVVVDSCVVEVVVEVSRTGVDVDVVANNVVVVLGSTVVVVVEVDEVVVVVEVVVAGAT